MMALVFYGSYGQTISDILNLVNSDSLDLTLNEFTGEVTTIVNGNSVSLMDRTKGNNDNAADYLVNKFTNFGDYKIERQKFNATGNNIIASRLGKTNPNKKVIICAHYDAAANYCADDNGTGVTALVEMARVFKDYCFDYTLDFVFFDEEETGTVGSRHYVSKIPSDHQIIAVLNVDMTRMGRMMFQFICQTKGILSNWKKMRLRSLPTTNPRLDWR